MEAGRHVDGVLGEYFIVNQVLSKGLHNADQECLVYTTSLMDKLEQVSLAILVGQLRD